MPDPRTSDDKLPYGPGRQSEDATYEDASYLGTDPDDDEEVQDLGFIVEDRQDRRVTFTDAWQRVDDIDSDEPLGKNVNAPIPHEESLRAAGAPSDWFATDYNVRSAQGEEQEDDFVQTSLLDADPDVQGGVEDFTSETDLDGDDELESTDLHGHVAGVIPGLGTSVPQDIGKGGFQIRDNPLMRSIGEDGEVISNENLGDAALGLRDIDEMGPNVDLDHLADLAAQAEERRQGDRDER